MGRPGKIVLLLVALSTLAVAAIAMQSDGVQWRGTILFKKASGQIDGISWAELLPMLKPGSRIYAGDLAEIPNPYAAIRNPYRSEDDVTAGAVLFKAKCMHCHGQEGMGGTAPNISSHLLQYGDGDWAIYRTLADGIDGTAMAPVKLSDKERWQIVGYLLRLRASGDETHASIRHDPIRSISVPYSRILEADAQPQNWLSYSRNYTGQRFSPLNGINKSSVNNLTLAWTKQTGITERIESSPIVVDGTMFTTLPEGVVLALDATSGYEHWRWKAKMDEDLPVCCGRVNRGAAILGDRIFVATLDNKLQNLDALTGKLVWEKTVADKEDGFTITVAPLAVEDKIVVGVSGGEYGIRGYLDAYDAKTGSRAWRFYTVPASGEAGNDTWAGDSWKTGGGPTWVTGSFDPELRLVYWGVGNPSPDFDGSTRAGDNLYTNSVVALDVDTGNLAWHYQFTPHDLHDFDSNQVPVLVDREVGGVPRTLMMWANRNGFFYLLDRATGEYLGSVPYAKQTWTTGIDDRGRPTRNPLASPTPKGVIVWPGSSGATNWPPPAYSPLTGLFYALTLERPSVYFNQEVPEPRAANELWLGGAQTFLPIRPETSLTAIDPDTLSVRWETVFPARFPEFSATGRYSGLLSTPELVFAGNHASIYALDAVSGEILWSSILGGQTSSPPISYAVGGKQYLTITAGGTIFSFSVPLPSNGS